MARTTLWGAAATIACALLAGCGGGRSSDPVTSGQALSKANFSRLDQAVVPYQKARQRDVHRTLQAEHPLSGTARTLPFTEQGDLPQVAGKLAMGGEGYLTGTAGTFRLEIDENLNGQVVFPRHAQAQGDHYLLSVDAFFGPSHVRPVGIERGANGTLDVTIRFKHPFNLPADLTPPATSVKRLDLHLFNLWAGVFVPGNDTFFSAPNQVKTDTNVLLNADSYRQTGGLVTLPGGLTGAPNAFPGKWVVDPGASNLTQGNYNGADNGWLGTELITAQGFGVFPQGGQADILFTVDPAGQTGPINIDFALLTDYQDPRGGITVPEKRANRLPDPFDPTRLRYILPFGAGDLQDVATTVQGGNLPQDNTRSVDVNIDITDFDADFGVTGAFPNEADLTEMPRASGIAGVTGHWPGLDPAVLTATESAGSGNGFPASPKKYSVEVFNNSTAVEGTYPGLIRIVDAESGQTAGEPYFQLNESLQPLAVQVPLEVYQAANLRVGAGTTVGNKVINLEADAGDPSFVLDDATPGAPFVPWVTDPATQSIGGLNIDDVIGSPTIAFAGPDFLDGTGYGRGSWHVFFEDPSNGGNFSLTGLGFLNQGADLFEARSTFLTAYVVSEGFVDPALNPTARGLWGWADLMTINWVSAFPDDDGRGIFPILDDLDLFYNDRVAWNANHSAGVTIRFSDITAATGPEVNPIHATGVDQTLISDMVESDFTRPGGVARDAHKDDLVIIQGLRGPYNPAQNTSPTITQVYTTFDWDDPAATGDEGWGSYAWTGPTANSQNRPTLMGAGAGKINPASTTGADLANEIDRLFICDDADDSVEVYQALPDGIDQINVDGDSMDDEFQYQNIVSPAGAVVDPIDITCVGDGAGGTLVVVLDKGGAGGFYRLVVLDPATLEVIGTRELDTDIPEGALSIAADESGANGLTDPTAFALLWDDPVGVTANGPVGGMSWYTIADA